MFNNIIYFIIVLLVFEISYPGPSPQEGLLPALAMLVLSWAVFAGYCRWGFSALRTRLARDTSGDTVWAGAYHRLVARLSVLAVFLFSLAVYAFDLKYWIGTIPGLERLSVCRGLLALALFLFYLCTIWYFAYPVHRQIFHPDIPRKAFIRSNLAFNIPVLFPWIVLTLVYDLIAFFPGTGLRAFLDTEGGQILFFTVFLVVLMIFLPAFIQRWWGCRPMEGTGPSGDLDAFLREKGFRYRRILTWPIFEGRLMTAAIMGIVPRYRYILVTDSLLEILDKEEVEAVLAHEMGHARYHHMIFYILFFVGFVVLSFGMFDYLPYVLYLIPFFRDLVTAPDPPSAGLVSLALSIPVILSLFVYFRYIMGFFMRNFERQADLYSASVMGSPLPTIRSLEKIALMSGKIRDLPSWHHFSIRQRVDVLWRTLKDPGLIRRHHRFVARTVLAYCVLLCGLGYFLNFGSVKQGLDTTLVSTILKRQIRKDPRNITLYQDLAMVYHQAGRYRAAIRAYEAALRLDPGQATALNNLAWLLATAADPEIRDPRRALELAKRAVAVQPSAVFLDTLAEAYFVNGRTAEAVETIKAAIAAAKENRAYYEKQLKKFRGNLD